MIRAEAGRELAGIVRDVRRALEREDARGLGELLARAAPPAAGESSAAPGRTAPAPVASPPAAPSPPAVVRETRAVAVAGPAEVDLFGNPVVAAPAPAAELAQPGPPEPFLLAPRGWAERETIFTASLPVLEAVAGEIAACRTCGLCETRTNTVPGVGSARSGIVFVGEAPGADEDAQGEPFVGRAGQLLTRIIKAMDEGKLIPGMPLSRETVFICNVLKCRPPENRNPLPHEIESCSPYLERQLAVLRPRVICCLGKFAAELLLGVKGTIASMRGRVYSWRGSKMIVTYHPAACLRNPGYKRPVWEDMQLVAREYLTD